MYVPGKWSVICDRCGWKLLNTDLRREWTGLRVCDGCWDPRHPQDFVKGRADRQMPPWTRPEPPDVFVEDEE